MTSWDPDLLRRRPRPVAEIDSLRVERMADTGSAPLLTLASDGNAYWVKTQHNPHGQLSLVVERFVQAMAQYLGAPVPECELINMPAEHVSGYRSSDGASLSPGVSHASLLVGTNSTEGDTLIHLKRDDNSRRAASYVALWEWCAGEDPHWLYSSAEDYSMWSFDHGLWIGGASPWELSELPGMVGVKSPWAGSIKDMDSLSFMELADRVEAFTKNHAVNAVATIPIDWGFADEDLIHLAQWAYDRRTTTAQRLRAYASNT